MRFIDHRFAAVAIALGLAASGCGGLSNADTDETKVESAPQTPSAPQTRSAPQTPVDSFDAEPLPPVVVQISGTRIRQFGLDSVEDFMADPYVAEVVLGTVIDTHVSVTGADLGVETVSTVKVSRARNLERGDVITVREPGGVVELSRVRGDFEGKGQPPLTGEDLNRMVDYTYEGTGHPRAGGRALWALVKIGDNEYGTILRLEQDDARLVWPSEHPPSEKWDVSFPMSAVDAFVRARRDTR